MALRLGVRGKLFLVSVSLIVVGVVVLEVWVRRALDRQLTDQIRRDLIVRLRLAELAVAQATPPAGGTAAWDALADDLGHRAQARITLIAPDGRVLGDSELPLAALAAVENHRDRPEVSEALLGGESAAVRLSTTLDRRMMYAAMPLHGVGRASGVVRVAFPLTDVDDAIGRFRRVLFTGALLAIVLVILMSIIAAHVMSRALRSVTGAARRMARGDLQPEPAQTGHDEIGELSRALSQVASNLSGTLADLRAERDRLGRILEGMQEGVLVLDREGRIVLVNPALRALLLPLGGVADAPAEIARHAGLKEILDRARGEGGPASGEIAIAGLRPRILRVQAAPLEGDPPGIVVVLVDVTEIRRLETMRRDFVANASHELRTPVTAVGSAAETLKAGAIDDPQAAARFLDIIERNAGRLRALLDDLLELSRLESREYRPVLKPVDPARAIDQVVDLFRERADRRKIHLLTAVDAAAGPGAVRADAKALDQILGNLVDNAIKYAGEGTEITLGARTEGDLVRFSVADTGPGIEPRHLPRLFERFYRIDPGRSRDVGGTGLGLSIVKHLVEAMGGTVGVDSAAGRGTTFKFTIALDR